MKIYTKTGDSGETGLTGGQRVAKNHAAIEVCGELDELNSLIGVARCQQLDTDFEEPLSRIQSQLFDLGSRVAACLSDSERVAQFSANRSSELESLIDQYQAELPELTSFVLPAGSLAGSHLHHARSVCRRAERRLLGLMQEKIKRDLSVEMVYLNRLSDFLFVAARLANHRSGAGEILWQPTR